MQEDRDTNVHHCVPHSFDGASADVNLSRPPKDEHDRLHTVLGHAPPDFSLRRMLIGNVLWMDDKERSLPYGMYEDILPILTPNDWHTLYVPDTFIPPSKNGHAHGEAQRIARVSFHLAWYLDRERSLVTDLLGLLGINKYPIQIEDQMRRIGDFFEKTRPHVAMRKFLLDCDTNGDLKWVKPLQEDIRQKLLHVLRSAKLESHTQNRAKQRIFDCLLDHHMRLVECARIWQPNLRDHAETLKSMTDGLQKRTPEWNAGRCDVIH